MQDIGFRKMSVSKFLEPKNMLLTAEGTVQM